MRIGLTENIRMREITRNANARGSTAKKHRHLFLEVSFRSLFVCFNDETAVDTRGEKLGGRRRKELEKVGKGKNERRVPGRMF